MRVTLTYFPVIAVTAGAISIKRSKDEDEDLLSLPKQTAMSHLSEQLARSVDRIKVQTRHGVLTGARVTNGAIAFLGSFIRLCFCSTRRRRSFANQHFESHLI